MAGRDEKVKEWFSRAFLVATSAVAGFKVSWEHDDIDGVDVCVKDGGVSTDWQMKATAHPRFRDGSLLFDLDVTTYNKLRVPRTAEAYLGVVVLPGEARASWITHKADHLVLRRTGYWLKLTGQSPTKNKARIRLSIPEANRLDANQIQAIMHAARKRVQQ